MKKWSFVGLGIFVLIFLIVYWFYFSKPSSFLPNERLLEKINHVLPQANANVIQDTIHVDERHMVAPFISKQDQYGLSYWEWQKHKWNLVSYDTSGAPRVWKINRKDPSSFYIVWNIHPNDQISYLKFYLIRDRGFQISGGISTYTPSVQMERKVYPKLKSYGMMALPAEWKSFMIPLVKVESAKQPNVFFKQAIPDNGVYIGWIPYNRLDQMVVPEAPASGNEYSSGVDIDFVRLLNESEIWH